MRIEERELEAARDELEMALDTPAAVCAESRSLRPDRWDWLEVREYLVLKYDGKTERFPVLDGDAAQARLRAALVQRPSDSVVVVTEDAYIMRAPGNVERTRRPDRRESHLNAATIPNAASDGGEDNTQVVPQP